MAAGTSGPSERKGGIWESMLQSTAPHQFQQTRSWRCVWVDGFCLLASLWAIVAALTAFGSPLMPHRAQSVTPRGLFPHISKLQPRLGLSLLRREEALHVRRAELDQIPESTTQSRTSTGRSNPHRGALRKSSKYQLRRSVARGSEA